jgi:hypothetical protein
MAMAKSAGIDMMDLKPLGPDFGHRCDCKAGVSDAAAAF